MSPDDLQAALNQEFRASAWGERGKAIVLAPELETWVWSDSPHVAAVAGWAERRPRLRQWLNDHGLQRRHSLADAIDQRPSIGAGGGIRQPKASCH